MRMESIDTSTLRLRAGSPKLIKKGFTLAEVLITLGIIGVIAAIVLPSLINGYKKKVWVSQLQKQYSIGNKVFKKMMIDNGADHFSDTELMQTIGSNNYYGYIDRLYGIPEVPIILKKYFDIAEIRDDEYKISLLGNDNLSISTGVNLPFQMADGSRWGFFFTNNIGSLSNSRGQLFIDVNGKKGPNKQGRDFFQFHVDIRGRMVADYTLIGIFGNGSDWSRYSLCGTRGSSTIRPNDSGAGCFARIVEEGWKMNY